MDTYARTIRTHQQSLSLLLNEPRTATVIGTALQARQLLDGVLEVAQDICRKPRLTLGMTYFQIVDVVTIETQTGKTQIIAFHKGSIRSAWSHIVPCRWSKFVIADRLKVGFPSCFIRLMTK